MSLTLALKLYPPLAANLLALGVGLRFWKRLDFPLRVMTAYLALCAVTTVALVWLSRYRATNYVLVHAFTPFQVLAFGLMYAGWNEGRARRAWWMGTGLVLVLWGALFPFENPDTFQGASFHLMALALMLGSMILLWQQVRDLRTGLFERPAVWVLTGLLGEQAFSFFLHLSRDWLRIHAMPTLQVLAVVRAFVVLGSYLCFAWSFRCHLRRRA